MQVNDERVAPAVETKPERYVIMPEPVPKKRRRRRKQKFTEILDADSASLVQGSTNASTPLLEKQRRRKNEDCVNPHAPRSKRRRRRKKKITEILDADSSSLTQKNTSSSVSLKNEVKYDTISATIDRVLADIARSLMEPATGTLSEHQDAAATTVPEQEVGDRALNVMKNSLSEDAVEEQETVNTERLEPMEAEQECFLELDFTLLMSTISECVSCRNCRGSIRIVETSELEQQTECVVQCDTLCGELCAFPFKVHRDCVV